MNIQIYGVSINYYLKDGCHFHLGWVFCSCKVCSWEVLCLWVGTLPFGLFSRDAGVLKFFNSKLRPKMERWTSHGELKTSEILNDPPLLPMKESTCHGEPWLQIWLTLPKDILKPSPGVLCFHFHTHGMATVSVATDLQLHTEETKSLV